MTRFLHRGLTCVVFGMAATLSLGVGVAEAGPKGPPDYGDGAGQQNPQGLEHCWHEDPVKCFATGWAQGEEVHIVADPFTGDGMGVVTFWCQSIVGFKYQIWVAELEPMTTYTVTTTGSLSITLGSFRTDPGGYGTLNGLIKLDPGEYYLVLQVKDDDGVVVLDTHLDGQGFGVFAH